MRDILFMGEVLASVTHEMQNVMAIIKESGALADDILQIDGMPRLRHGDKLETALRNIREQVDRGRNLMIMLNGFAHAAADFPESGDLLRFARQICILAERMAKLKECTLVPELDGLSLPVRGNALMLMRSIYLALAALLTVNRPGDAIHVRVVRAEDSTSLEFFLDAAEAGRDTPDLSVLGPVMAELGGACDARPGFLALRFAPAPALGGAAL